MKTQNISVQNLQPIPAKRSPAVTAKAKADTFALAMKPIIDALSAGGIVTPSAVATALILQGAVTARGGQWNTTLVLNLTRRLEVLTSTEKVA